MTREGDAVGYRGIRKSAAFHLLPDLRCLKLTGGRAFDVLDAVCPCDLFLRSGEARPTVLLQDDGVVFADACVCRDGETAYIIYFGPETDEVSHWIRSYVPDFADLAITDLGQSHRAVSLDGPYAWELCAELFGSDVVGIPPLGMMLTDKAVLFRIERTGEYGYCALVPRDEWNSFADELQTKGAEFDLAQADAAAWSQAVLENFSFDMGREGRYDLTPMALQLQWRLSSRKERYPGSDAIRSLRESGWDQRLTLVSASDLIAPEAEVTCGGKPVGRVLASGYSPLRGDYVGKALIRRPYWHAGLDGFRVETRRLTSISAPAIRAMSMKVSPYRHSFHTRHDDIA